MQVDNHSLLFLLVLVSVLPGPTQNHLLQLTHLMLTVINNNVVINNFKLSTDHNNNSSITVNLHILHTVCHYIIYCMAYRIAPNIRGQETS